MKTAPKVGSPVHFTILNHAIRRSKYSAHSSPISLELLPKRQPKRGVFGWLMAFSFTELIGAKDKEPVEVKKIMNKAKKILEVMSLHHSLYISSIMILKYLSKSGIQIPRSHVESSSTEIFQKRVQTTISSPWVVQFLLENGSW